MARVPSEEFRHSFAVPAPAERIYAHLSEPDSYIGLSPLVVEVRDVRRDGDRVSYVAVERFRLGPLRHDNPIAVTMTFPQPGRRLVSDVVSPARVRLVATVDLLPEGDGTRVTETVRVSFPALLRPLVLGQARKVQRARAAELTRRMAVTAT
jgi:carbon monoxide dehydrogenase subunit G